MNENLKTQRKKVSVLRLFLVFLACFQDFASQIKPDMIKKAELKQKKNKTP